MSKSKEIARLAQISKLILDVKLAALHGAANRRQQSLDLLAQLENPIEATDLCPIKANQANLRYQRWADLRRAEINIALARQSAEMLLARDHVGEAFSKNQALLSLSRRKS